MSCAPCLYTLIFPLFPSTATGKTKLNLLLQQDLVWAQNYRKKKVKKEAYTDVLPDLQTAYLYFLSSSFDKSVLGNEAMHEHIYNECCSTADDMRYLPKQLSGMFHRKRSVCTADSCERSSCFRD